MVDYHRESGLDPTTASNPRERVRILCLAYRAHLVVPHAKLLVHLAGIVDGEQSDWPAAEEATVGSGHQNRPRAKDKGDEKKTFC